ncbi:M20/M25/M40 family metallo-hydrolase [Candidatus Saccharibacteria bacterium]|nr:M20/M25/M40 family metallo-hydrolase [Candidatus Saccharibacteria bacterium]
MKHLQQNLERTLAELVSIPSDSYDPEACRRIISYIHEQLTPLGLYVTADLTGDHPWLVATTRQTMRPKLLLVAHVDVVAASGGQFEMRTDEEKLYGRGVWDMKYAAAVYLEYLKDNAEHLAALDIGVMFTTDEETGGFDGVRLLLEQGWRTSLALIPDYRDHWTIEEMAKGLRIKQLTARGNGAHGSRPWETVNPIDSLMTVGAELKALYPSDAMYGPTLSITNFNAGKFVSQIPSSASMTLDFRAFEQDEIELYETTLLDMTRSYGLEVTDLAYGAPVHLDSNHPMVMDYVKALLDSGVAPRYQKSLGATDARWFAEHHIPCIVTGPSGHGAHSDNEWIYRRDLVFFYHLLTNYVAQTGRISTASVVATPVDTSVS